MAAATPLPSLFGRFTAVLSQHEDLGDTLRRLSETCAALEAGRTELPSYLEPAPLLDGLRDELTAHFHTEQGEAYFGTIAREKPRLLPDLIALEAEHAEMLETVSELVTLAGRRDVPHAFIALARRFVAQLRAHEHAESKLLQEYFLRDESSGSQD